MTRLNIKQTCLLDVSGELGKKAADQLHQHTTQFPAALLEHEIIRGQFELLQSFPKVQLSESDKRRIADNIKRGIHRTLTSRDRERRSAFRWRLAYRALAGVSGIAACLVIAGALYLVDKDAQHREQEKIARATESVTDYLATDTTSNQTDQDVTGVANDIDAFVQQNNSLASQGDGTLRLIDALSPEPQNNSSDEPPGM